MLRFIVTSKLESGEELAGSSLIMGMGVSLKRKGKD